MKELIVVGLVIGSIIGGLYQLAKYECTSKYGDSGFATRFGPIIGCQINSGGWIPVENWRVM